MFEVFGFYKFKKLISLKKNKLLIQDFLIKKSIRGTVIIAKEGLNGTLSGKTKDIRDSINKIKKIFSIKEFNDHVSNDKRVEQIIIPFGDGMTVCRVL